MVDHLLRQRDERIGRCSGIQVCTSDVTEPYGPAMKACNDRKDSKVSERGWKTGARSIIRCTSIRSTRIVSTINASISGLPRFNSKFDVLYGPCPKKFGDIIEATVDDLVLRVDFAHDTKCSHGFALFLNARVPVQDVVSRVLERLAAIQSLGDSRDPFCKRVVMVGEAFGRFRSTDRLLKVNQFLDRLLLLAGLQLDARVNLLFDWNALMINMANELVSLA